MKVAVTGADGFLGWHTRCALKAAGIDSVPIDRSTFEDQARLEAALVGADVIFHAAGVNRDAADEVRDRNISLAHDLTAALDRAGVRPAVIFANSIQSGNGTPFGDGKQAAVDHLTGWGSSAGAPVADIRLPNLFGEHGRPYYNSVVATFCHELATGGEPRIDVDREILLLHVQDAVDQVIELAKAPRSGVVSPEGTATRVSRLLRLLDEFRDLYATGEIPDLTDSLHLALFNTYRSFCFPQQYPIVPPPRSDERGTLFECLRGRGGQAQVFCSTTRPGATRGQHFHLRKVERFVVLRGRAEIALRRLFGDTVVRFDVTGDVPAIVDMPTMWAHSIKNTGSDDLLTLFWAHEIFDPARADTFPELVVLAAESAAIL